MNRHGGDRCEAGSSVPRTRGDEPVLIARHRDDPDAAFPARAGMNRSRPSSGGSTAFPARAGMLAAPAGLPPHRGPCAGVDRGGSVKIRSGHPSQSPYASGLFQHRVAFDPRTAFGLNRQVRTHQNLAPVGTRMLTRAFVLVAPTGLGRTAGARAPEPVLDGSWEALVTTSQGFARSFVPPFTPPGLSHCRRPTANPPRAFSSARRSGAAQSGWTASLAAYHASGEILPIKTNCDRTRDYTCALSAGTFSKRSGARDALQNRNTRGGFSSLRRP